MNRAEDALGLRLVPAYTYIFRHITRAIVRLIVHNGTHRRVIHPHDALKFSEIFQVCIVLGSRSYGNPLLETLQIP